MKSKRKQAVLLLLLAIAAVVPAATILSVGSGESNTPAVEDTPTVEITPATETPETVAETPWPPPTPGPLPTPLPIPQEIVDAVATYVANTPLPEWWDLGGHGPEFPDPSPGDDIPNSFRLTDPLYCDQISLADAATVETAEGNLCLGPHWPKIRDASAKIVISIYGSASEPSDRYATKTTWALALERKDGGWQVYSARYIGEGYVTVDWGWYHSTTPDIGIMVEDHSHGVTFFAPGVMSVGPDTIVLPQADGIWIEHPPIDGEPPPEVRITLPSETELVFDFQKLTIEVKYETSYDKALIEQILAQAKSFQRVDSPIPPAPTESPSTTPATGKIAFSSDRDGNDEIYVMNADGSDLTRLTNNSGRDAFPTWSPDGSRIAFGCSFGDDGEICVINADGSGLIRLTNNSPTYEGSFAWSPDGSRIAFQANRPIVGDEIYVVNVDGSDPTRLTNNPWQDDLPAWSPVP